MMKLQLPVVATLPLMLLLGATFAAAGPPDADVGNAAEDPPGQAAAVEQQVEQQVEELEQRIAQLEAQLLGETVRLETLVEQLQRRVRVAERQARQPEARITRERTDSGLGFVVLFLSGTLCALWAQNTGRSATLWFIFGFFCSCIALAVLLYENASYQRPGEARRPPKAMDWDKFAQEKDTWDEPPR